MPDFTTLTDLAAERLGGAVLLANDEFFAPKENLLKAAPAVWREGEYTDRGKWMDGWETRRRRESGHDWCIIRLGAPGIVRGVVVDTAFFRGNYPEHCSIEATDRHVADDAQHLAAPTTRWVPILPKSALQGDAKNPFAVDSPERWTYLRLNIFPDGGVARLRVHGDVVPDWTRVLTGGGWVDLAAIEHGGRVIAQSDAFFGNANNMLLPGRSTHMGDGWETKRRRGGGTTGRSSVWVGRARSTGSSWTPITSRATRRAARRSRPGAPEPTRRRWTTRAGRRCWPSRRFSRTPGTCSTISRIPAR